MLEKEEDESGKFSIKIEEYNLDPERNSFEDELRKSYSKKSSSFICVKKPFLPSSIISL